MKKSSLKNKPIIIVAIILFFVLSTTSVGIVIYNNINNGNGSALFSKPMSTNSKIGVSYKVIGTVQRNVPSVCKDEGLLRYPEYGQTLTKSATETDADFTALKQAILDENAYLNFSARRNDFRRLHQLQRHGCQRLFVSQRRTRLGQKRQPPSTVQTHRFAKYVLWQRK